MGMTFDSMRSRRGLSLPLIVTVLIALPVCSRAQSSTPIPRVITSASIVASDVPELPSCRSLECVRRHVTVSTTVRLAGEFMDYDNSVPHQPGILTSVSGDLLAEVDPPAKQ